MLLSARTLLLSAATVTRRAPLLAQRSAAFSMSATGDIAEWTKAMWADVAATGQTKDMDKINAVFDKCAARAPASVHTASRRARPREPWRTRRTPPLSSLPASLTLHVDFFSPCAPVPVCARCAGTTSRTAR